MLLGLAVTYIAISILLVGFVLRAKNLAVSDGLRFNEDLEQMRAIRPRGRVRPASSKYIL